MSDKLEALKAAALALKEFEDSNPRGWQRRNEGKEIFDRFDELVDHEVVLSLLAALEEASKRTEAESVGADKSAVNAVEWMKRANAAEQREDHLKADVAVMGKRITELEREKTNIAMLCADTCAKAKQKHDELEQRLQQPIAIPAGFRIVPIKATREQLAAVQVAGKSVVYTDMVMAAPEHPCFKVEGE